MSSPSSSFTFSMRHQQHPHPLRKGVPDGSQDFQKVLVTILSNSSKGDISDSDPEIREEDEDECYYDDDFEFDCYGLDGHDFIGSGKKEKPSSIGNSNRERDNDNIQYRSKSDGECEYDRNVSKNVCDFRKCKTQDDINNSLTTQNSIPISGAVSPSHINIFDCNGDLLYDSQAVSVDNGDSKRDIKFPSIDKGRQNKQNRIGQSNTSSENKMGTTCSTGLYDQREWHDIMTKEGGLTQTNGKKRGKPLNKKQLTKDRNGVSSSQPCTCRYRISDSSLDPASEPIPIPGSEVNDNTILSDSYKNEHNFTLPGSSPRSRSLEQPTPTISRSLSPNQGRLSKILSFKKHSPTPKPDAPHRLLVRRSYSPKSRASSMEEMIRLNNDSVYRQRSHSWSNGKLNAKPGVKISSSTNTIIQSPIFSPVAHHNALVPVRHASFTNSNSPKSDKSKDKLFPELHRGQMVSNSVHEQSCPLYKQSHHKDRLSPNDGFDVDDSITPMSRRRAVSESQTFRARQKARRAVANAAKESQEEPDHLHVHWADEERGSSLSTSVFLTSIRPRSYSHGAECNIPHRPILKKVIIS